jgi:uracil phosphoribosyltransferase
VVADVLCNPDTQTTGEAVINCQLYAKHQTQANDISVLRITPASESIERVAKKAESGIKIISGDLELILGEFDQKE